MTLVLDRPWLKVWVCADFDELETWVLRAVARVDGVSLHRVLAWEELN